MLIQVFEDRDAFSFLKNGKLKLKDLKIKSATNKLDKFRFPSDSDSINSLDSIDSHSYPALYQKYGEDQQSFSYPNQARAHTQHPDHTDQ